jgi:hypothetical protein
MPLYKALQEFFRRMWLFANVEIGANMGKRRAGYLEAESLKRNIDYIAEAC